MQTQPTISGGQLRWSLGLLCVISTLNFVDRQILTILSEPIKNELQLADWELGALNGIAFVLCYCLLSLPAARIADRWHRPRLLGIAIAIWSAFTALCGYASNFAMLALARAGVSVGESAANPTAQALISDYVPREKRAGALAIYNIGVPLGAMFGMAIGGVVADAHGWRAAFLVVGIPGLLVALLAWLTLPEPRAKVEAKDAPPTLPWGQSIVTLLKKPSFNWLMLGVMMFGAVNLGLFIFVGSFFMRNHLAELTELGAMFHMGPLAFLGVALGLSAGITGVIGGIFGGRVTDHFVKRDVRANLWVPITSMLISIPIYYTMLFSPSAIIALCVLSIHTMVLAVNLGPVVAAIISLAPPQSRATAASLNLIAGNLIGVGFGPILIGLVSDMFNASGMSSGDGLRYSLMLTKTCGLVFVFALFMALRTYKKDYVG